MPLFYIKRLLDYLAKKKKRIDKRNKIIRSLFFSSHEVCRVAIFELVIKVKKFVCQSKCMYGIFWDLRHYPTAIRLIVLVTEIQNGKVHPFKFQNTGSNSKRAKRRFKLVSLKSKGSSWEPPTSDANHF